MIDPSTIDIPATAGLTVAALVALVLAVMLARYAGRTIGTGTRLENVLTLAAAGIATGVAATGMWRFFSDVLAIHSVGLRAALFAFLEMALFVSALRARRNLLDDIARGVANPSTGIDGKAVWVIAALSGVFAAMDARSLAEAVFRVAAPLVAAWLWERGLAAHRRRARGADRNLNWRLTPERILVALRLAEPTDRTAGDVDAARRRARLVRAAYRLHTLRAAGASKRQIGRAHRTLVRQIESATEHLQLGTNPDARAAVREALATLIQAEHGLTSAAVADLSPWGPSAAEQAAIEPVVEAPKLPQSSPHVGEIVPAQPMRLVRPTADEAAALAQVVQAAGDVIPVERLAVILGRSERTVRAYRQPATGEQKVVKRDDHRIGFGPE